jgi:AraC-like DNA-binding protein
VGRVTTTQTAAPVVTADLIETAVTAPESLRPWITELGRIQPPRDLSEPFTHVPNTATTIVLRTDESGRRDALVLGPRTHADYSVADKPAGCLRLRLAPGATRPLLGVPAADLADRVFRLAELPGVAGDLAEELAQLDQDQVLQFLEDVLPQHLSEDPTQRTHRQLLRTAVAAMSSGGPATPVHELAASLAVSERQLRNLFTTGIGVSPKHYARIGRVRHVLANAGNTPWSQLAASTGYYDQSHMTADFRTLMGVPPTSFLRGNLPAATPCQSPRHQPHAAAAKSR